MGNKLDYGEELESYGNIQKFRRIYGKSNLCHVIAKKKGKVIVDVDIDVIIRESRYGREEVLNVDISWENVGLKNYNSLGLFGYYSSSFCKTDFDGLELIVHSDNNVDIYIVVQS